MWSYDATKLNDATLGSLYQVRLLIRDNIATRQLLQDEELLWFISEEANIYAAAAAACETLVVAAGSVKSKSVADTSVTYDVGFYRTLGQQLRSRSMFHQLPYCGGISIEDKEAQQADTDAVQPRAFRSLGDNPGANQPAPATDQNSLTRTP